MLTHAVAGLGVLLAVLGLTFSLTYALGTPVQEWWGVQFVQPLAEWLRTALSAAPNPSLRARRSRWAAAW
jgi:Fe2+ transport system protein B